MLTHDEEKIAQEWKKYQGYTIRPVPSTLSYYGEIVASHSGQTQFLLYGGTPEIRSIFQKLRYRLTLVDRSTTMVRAMGLLTEAQTPIAANERFLRQAWLKPEGLKEEFDILIGDDAINMVAWSEFELFLQQAWRILRPGGLFICHLLVKPRDDLIHMKLSELENEFRRGSIKSVHDVASRLNFLCWNKKSYAMGWQQTIKRLGKDSLARFRPELDFVETFGLCNSYFVCPPIQLFDHLVEQYFTVREVFYPHEHEYCIFEPIYVLEKRSKRRVSWA